MNRVEQAMRDREAIARIPGATHETQTAASVAGTAFRDPAGDSGDANAAELQRVHGNDNLAPLVIDLDGALSRTNMLLECTLAFIRHRPLRIFQVLSWLAKGRSVLKQELTRCVPLDAMALPLDPALAAYAAGEKAKGRKVYLAVTEDHPIAQSMANRWGFDGVLVHDASSADQQGRDAGEEAFPSGFTHAGGSGTEFSAWPRAQ